jgi:predicted metal-dependent HD superfamily phosphohydrolase
VDRDDRDNDEGRDEGRDGDAGDDDVPAWVPAALWAEVLAAWSTPGRAYHDVTHLRAVLREWRAIDAAGGWRAPRETWLACAFHDAVYAPGAPHGQNERDSAALARAAIARHGLAVDAARVTTLIDLTARHGQLSPDDLADDPDAARFLDADMAILAADAATYDRYEAGVAAEYAQVPRALYDAGRRAFLAGLLARPRIFLSDDAHAARDAAARDNLRRALAQKPPPA